MYYNSRILAELKLFLKSGYVFFMYLQTNLNVKKVTTGFVAGISSRYSEACIVLWDTINNF